MELRERIAVAVLTANGSILARQGATIAHATETSRFPLRLVHQWAFA